MAAYATNRGVNDHNKIRDLQIAFTASAASKRLKGISPSGWRMLPDVTGDRSEAISPVVRTVINMPLKCYVWAVAESRCDRHACKPETFHSRIMSLPNFAFYSVSTYSMSSLWDTHDPIPGCSVSFTRKPGSTTHFSLKNLFVTKASQVIERSSK
jgi:hypothetical protein